MFCTVEGAQYRRQYLEYHGGYDDACGGYLEYRGGHHDACGDVIMRVMTFSWLDFSAFTTNNYTDCEIYRNFEKLRSFHLPFNFFSGKDDASEGFKFTTSVIVTLVLGGILAFNIFVVTLALLFCLCNKCHPRSFDLELWNYVIHWKKQKLQPDAFDSH